MHVLTEIANEDGFFTRAEADTGLANHANNAASNAATATVATVRAEARTEARWCAIPRGLYSNILEQNIHNRTEQITI